MLLGSCGSEPDLLELGARELPGTLGADYLGAQPFAVAPDGSRLVFATSLDAVQMEASPLDLHRHRLMSFRIFDLHSGNIVSLPEPPARVLETVDRYGLPHRAPCWLNDSRSVLFHTAFPKFLRFGPLDAEPAWTLVDGKSPGLQVRCGERHGPVIGARDVGRFRIERPGGTALRVSVAGQPGALFEMAPEGVSTQVTVSGAALAPDGDRLALTYASGLGSFTGRSHGVVVSARRGEPAARALGGGVLVLDWLNPSTLIGYARPSGRKAFALFTWELAR